MRCSPPAIRAAPPLPCRFPARCAAVLGRYEGRVVITALHGGLRGVGKTALGRLCEPDYDVYRASW
jgi:hypothetical protein